MTSIDNKHFEEEKQKLIDEFNLRQQQKQLENNLSEFSSRARSILVGTAFGGVVEIGMRCADGRLVFSILQPVEVIELIHQVSACIGCVVRVEQRKDFATWRHWKDAEGEPNTHRVGHGEFPPMNDVSLVKDIGANMPLPKQQPGFQAALMAKETKDEQSMAIKKTVKRRSTKRTAKTT